MTKTVMIGGKEVKMQASAATPVFYRRKFGKDMLVQIAPMMAGKEMDDYSVFENMAYIMAKRADDSIPDDVVEWLEQFDSAMAIYDASAEIMAVWLASQKTTSTSKKKNGAQSVK